MVSWWVIDSYFNIELIQISDIEIMISAYGVVTHIQSEELIYVQKQHQFMDQFTNIILIIHTPEVTSVGYHNQLLKN